MIFIRLSIYTNSTYNFDRRDISRHVSGITDWGPELWTTARVAQLAMAEWIVLSPAAACEFDFEYHNYTRLRDRIATRKRLLRTQQQELGLRGWDNVIAFE